ncbi:MAG: hypothetical protein MUD17_05575 [Gemmatimonadaceae bacterium]|jgi:hypothetical protein|nr:hypothetical protein [Gemmatimonadaceae bacterium]
MTRTWTDEQLKTAVAAMQAKRAATADPATVSLDDLLALVERRGSEAVRLATLDAVMRDPRARAEFDLLRALTAGMPRDDERPASVSSEASSSRGGAWWSHRVTLLAAAAVLAVVIVPAGWRMRTSASRQEPLRNVGAATQLLAPATSVSLGEARRFTWYAMSGVHRYRFELLSVEGLPVFTARTTDTVLVLPTDVPLTANTEYRWWVVTERTDGTQRPSPFRRLFVRSTP